MPQKPIMPSPYMQTVDADEGIALSCVVDNQDTIVGYKHNITRISATPNADAYQVVIPPVFVGSAVDTGLLQSKLSFYAESEDSTEFTMVACPHGSVSGDAPITFTAFNFGNKIIDKTNINQIVIKSNKMTALPSKYISNFSGLKKVGFDCPALTTIRSQAIYKCPSIEELRVPDTVTNIYGTAVSRVHLKNLFMSSTSILSNGSKNIDLLNCENVYLTNQTTIENDCFEGCNYLKKVVFYKNVTQIGDRAFYKCSNLESVVGVQEATSIGASAFCLCPKFKNFFVESSKIATIGKDAFSGSGLNKIILTSTITSIGTDAFKGCCSMKSLQVIGTTSATLTSSTTNHSFNFFVGTTQTEEVSVSGDTDSSILEYAIEELTNSGVSFTLKDCYQQENYTPTPVYGGRGNDSVITFIPAANYFQNDCEYKWNITLKDNYGREITSPEYYFKTRSKPIIKLNQNISDTQEKMLLSFGTITLSHTPAEQTIIETLIPKIKILDNDNYFNYYESALGVAVAVGNVVHPLITDDVAYDNGFALQTKLLNLDSDNKGSIYYYKTVQEGTSDSYIEKVEVEGTYQESDSGNTTTYKFIPTNTTEFTASTVYSIEYDGLYPSQLYNVRYYYKGVKPAVSHIFTADYSQQNMKCIFNPCVRQRWKIYHIQDDLTTTLIDDSGDIYSSYLTYSFDRFIPSESYSVSVEVENSEQMIAYDSFDFECDAIGTAMTTVPSIYLDKTQNAVVLDFMNCSTTVKYTIVRENMIDGSTTYIAYTNGYCKIYDYTASSRTPYKYYIQGSQGGEITGYLSNVITPEWDRIIIVGFDGSFLDKSPCEAVKKDVWKFEFDTKIESFTQNLTSTLLSAVSSQYARVSKGSQGYLTLSVSALLGSEAEDGGYTGDNITVIRKWLDFASSIKPKLISDSKGHILIGEITGNKYSYNTTTIQEETTVDFSFTETAPLNGKSIYRKE